MIGTVVLLTDYGIESILRSHKALTHLFTSAPRSLGIYDCKNLICLSVSNGHIIIAGG